MIDKPSGLLTHPVNRTDTSDSVVGWVTQKYPKIKEVQDKHGKAVGQWVDLRPGIVHRLDKETSGLLIIAKNQVAFDYLKRQFQERKIQKTYIALVHGKIKNKSGTIDAPVGKLGTRQTTRIHGKKELTEKTALTEYKMLGYYVHGPEAYTLVEVFPKTGRTHQIRVHLKSIGHPVVCDPFYGGKNNVCPPELGRLFLHAQKLAFTTPTGKALALEIDLPANLAAFLEILSKIEF